MIACPIEDRLAIQDLMISYATAVDSLHDLDGICELFVEDVVFDLSGINFPSLVGRGQVRKFFEDTFNEMSAHAHYLTNFAVTAYAGDTASMQANVIGLGHYKAGGEIAIYGRYYWDVVRTADGWKGARYTMSFLLPPKE